MHISVYCSVVLREHRRSKVIQGHIIPYVNLKKQRCKLLSKISIRCTRERYFTMKRLQEASKYVTEVNTDTHLK